MARKYIKSQRAANQAETRQRIIEAAVRLHHEAGPARTTVSQVAERAGVQRHTVYAHFPDERSLLLACSGLHLQRNPLPTPTAWAGIADRAARLEAGMAALYGWYARNADITAAVLRDAEHHAVVREVSQARMGAPLAAIRDSLGEGLGRDGRAALALALDFHAWRTLVRDAGLPQADAVSLMARMVAREDR